MKPDITRDLESNSRNDAANATAMERARFKDVAAVPAAAAMGARAAAAAAAAAPATTRATATAATVAAKDATATAAPQRQIFVAPRM